ncbi:MULTISPECIES: YncE family protein [unclassified Rhodanobacter]|uniref:YncE family protein n=1 Tax=Rhodanobacter humi TaxID=1888173 RepID=A0ABV4AWE5_9GAMM
MKKTTWTLLLATVVGMPSLSVAATTGTGYAVTRHVALGGAGGWDYLSLDEATHRLFIARDNRVMVVDADSGKLVDEIPGMQHAHGVALAPALKRAYVSNGRGNDVSVVDLATLKVVDTIPVSGRDPDAIIYDEASGDVLAMDGDSNEISIIDTKLGKEVATIALGSNPEFPVIDGKGKLYVNLEGSSQLAEVNLRERKVEHVWPLAPCKGPTGLAVDAVGHRLFSVCANGWMIVTNADDGKQVARLPIGKSPDAVTYDAGLHNVLASSGEGSLGVVHQIDADHYAQAMRVPTMRSARTLALDSSTHQVFMVGAATHGHGKPVTGFSLLVAAPH